MAGYASRSGAYKAFWKALDHHEAQAVEDHRALELARLDALQVALWDDAINGDVKAVNAVLRIIEQRSRLLGLDKPGSAADGQTVVLSPADLADWKETQGRDSKHASWDGYPYTLLTGFGFLVAPGGS